LLALIPAWVYEDIMDTHHSGQEAAVLEVVTYSFGGIPLLSLAGDFDHSSLPLFRERARQAMGDGGSRLLLQLTDTVYIDSGGVSSLLSLLHQVRNKGWLGVIGPGPDVMRLLQMVGLTLDPSFRVFSSLDEVEEFLQQGLVESETAAEAETV
jgi:anti-sigma B factor antagonist